MTSAWFLALAGVSFVILVVVPIVGARSFNANRARGVKYAEQDSEATLLQHISELAHSHPEIVKVPRVDRHPFFVFPHIGVWCYAWCIFLGASVTNNIAELAAVTRYTMAGCFLIGSSLVLTGALLGTRLGHWHLARRVRNHPTAALLGDDITLPYWLSIFGLFAVSVSMGIYSSTSFKTTTGSLGGWLTATLAFAAMATLPLLYRRITEFERNEATLLTEVQAKIERDGHADAG